MYVNNLEAARDFFVKYLGGRSNDVYHNPRTGFRSYFISFEDGARLEIMNKPEMPDPEKDLTIVEFKRPVDVLEAVKSGKVDVGIGATNIIGQSVQAGLASPLWSNDLWPNHPCCRIVVTEDALQKYRPELVKFLKAELLAEKKFVDDPQSGVRADVEQQKFGEKLASDLVLNPHLQFSVDPPDFSKVIDTTLYLEALQELRKEQPNEPFWEKLEQRYKDQNL